MSTSAFPSGENRIRCFERNLRRLLLCGFFFLAVQSFAQKDYRDEPAFVSCWDKKFEHYQTRTRQTPTLTSRTGFRAYAVIEAKALGGDDCLNTSRLFVAPPNGEFKQVYERGRVQTQNGNGINLIAWSPDGRHLLAEVVDWAWASDAGFGRTPLVASTEPIGATEIPGVGEALFNRYGDKCDYEFFSVGWTSKYRLRVKVTRPAINEEYNQRFCVSKPQYFEFDIAENRLIKVPTEVSQKRK